MANDAAAASLPMTGLLVRGGLHHGAIVALPEGVERHVGSGVDADVLLIDEGVDVLQCTVLWAGGDTVQVDVVADGMEAYGKRLQAGRQLHLPVGSEVAFSTVTLMIVALEATIGGDSGPVARDVPVQAQSAARQAVLRQLHWGLYALDTLRADKRIHRGAAALVLAALATTAVFHLLDATPTPGELRTQTVAELRRLFPDVQVRTDMAGDVVLYEGYVRDQRELNQLRSIALALDEGRTIVRVVPMDVLQFNASMWLDTYYRDPRIETPGPGRLEVTVPSELAIKQLAGWDFAAVTQRLMQELPELTSVNIAVARTEHEAIPIPAAQLGISLVPLHGGGTYVVGADGAPLFNGAATAEGRINEISRCSLSLHSRDTGALFRLVSGNEQCGKQHIPPAQSMPAIESVRGNQPP